MPPREGNDNDFEFFQKLGLVSLHLFVLTRTFSWTLWVSWCPALDLVAMAAPESHATFLFGVGCFNAVLAMLVELDWMKQPWFAAYLLVWFVFRYRDAIVIVLCLVGLCAGTPIALVAHLVLLVSKLVRTSRWCRSKTWRERYESLAVHTQTNGKKMCCICCEPMAAGEALRRLGCGHDFHLGCIDEWILGDCPCDGTRHHSCPMCRRDAVYSNRTHARNSDARRV